MQKHMRATTFVSKPSSTWTTLTDNLGSTRFYLMARIGPTVFQLKDDNDNSFKVTLGNPHRCSCLDTMQPCIHVAHCVIKILKVTISHPLAYQSSWTDTDLELVLSGACIASASSAIRMGNTRRLRILQRKKDQDTTPEEEEVDIGSVPRQKLDEYDESYCPICQEEMLREETFSLTWCRDGCGNNFHTECMMKYAKHLVLNHKDINCPLCRGSWNMDILQRENQRGKAMRDKIEKKKQEQKRQASLFRIIPVHCSQCCCVLPSTFYRCLNCSHLNFIKAVVSQVVQGTKQRICDLCEGCICRTVRNHINSNNSSNGNALSCDQPTVPHLFLTNDGSQYDAPEKAWRYIVTSGHSNNFIENRNSSIEIVPSISQLCSMMVDSLPTLRQLHAISPMHQRTQMNTFLNGAHGRCWICYEGLSDDDRLSCCQPCCHPAHRLCLLNHIQSTVSQPENGIQQQEQQGELFLQLLRLRCGVSGCNRRIFPTLKRTILKETKQKQSSQYTSSESDLTPLAVTATALNPRSESTHVNNNIIESSVAGGSNGKRIALHRSAKRFSQQFQSAILNDLQLNGNGLIGYVNDVVTVGNMREKIETRSFVPTETSFIIENSNRAHVDNFNSRFSEQQHAHTHMKKGRRLTDIRALSKARSLSAPTNSHSNDNSNLALNVVPRNSLRTEEMRTPIIRNEGNQAVLNDYRPRESNSHHNSAALEAGSSLESLLAVRNMGH